MKGQTYFILEFVFIIILSIFSVAIVNSVDLVYLFFFEANSLVFVIFFSVTNVDSIEVYYIFLQSASPLIFIILFSVLLGRHITILIGSIKYFKVKKLNKELKNKIDQSDSMKEDKPKT